MSNEPGITIHAVRAVTIHESTTLGATARVLSYGDEMVLTPQHIEACRDRNGHVALFDMLDDPNGPIRRGPWPAGRDKVLEGSAAWHDRRVAALRAAALLPDPDQQRAAAAAVREKYGVEPSARSRTVAVYATKR